MNNHRETWHGNVTDAYAHIGVPRFGSLENLGRYFDRLGIKQGVLVLGPGLPDFESIRGAREKYGQNICFMGIPFGETEAQRIELGELQISMGISGMRLMPFEVEPNKRLIDRLGEEGLWLFAINPYNSMGMTRYLVDWLDRFPKGRIASPHFLIPQGINQRAEDPALFRELLRHPRFHAILSRQGGVGSREPYPYSDLKPWVAEVVEWVTWRRLLWGGEFPIFYQRSEQPEEVRDWILNLGLELTHKDREDFYSGNAQRLFFEEERNGRLEAAIPGWVDGLVDRNARSELFPANSLYLPMEDYNTLLTDYLIKAEQQKDMTFSGYVTAILSETARRMRGK